MKKTFFLLFINIVFCIAQKDTQESRPIDFDLLHTELHLKPVWENQTIEGTANLILKPHFYEQSSLKLDARGFDLKSIKSKKQALKYTYDGEIIVIDLSKTYRKTDTLNISIVYIAQPNTLKSSGSAAISNDKGLYFINPTYSQKNYPRQLWTQGETQANSAWFPTIDSPNQNHTQDIFLTVTTNFTTLSNGILKNTKINTDGTKTDHWQQNIPHAVYLTMIAAGDFKKVIDTRFTEKEISYYLEPEYEKYALDIFGRTPEMMSYFENILGIKYPWQKYAQIPVRKYVSGAMENTTATVHSKTVLKDKRQLIDGNDDGVIAHELFHHWFGNLVTCESWSHLPLNESFANYSEFLWASHKYGKDEGDYVYLTALQDYIYESTQKSVPMIRYNFLDKEDMFDAHSYQKGGRILHLLRMEVGDEAFFKSLNYYLNKHSFQTAEIHDLRLAFEKITGKDLKWFFDQWFLRPGHPILNVKSSIANNKITLNIEQANEENALYQLNLPIEIYAGGKVIKKDLSINKAAQEFEISLDGNFETASLNPEGYFLGVINYTQNQEELLNLYKLSPYIYSRIMALESLTQNENAENEVPKIQNKEIRNLVLQALKDPYWRIRQMAVQKLFDYDGEDFLDVEKALQNLIKNDPKSLVRSDAILAVKNFLNPQNDLLFRQGILDSSYTVNAAALEALLTNNVEDSEVLVEQFSTINDINVFAAVANYYAAEGNPEKYDWFMERFEKMEGFEIYQNIGIFGSYLSKSDETTQEKAIPYLKSLGTNESEWYVRISAGQALMLLSEDSEKAKEALKDVIAKEKDERLMNYYKQFQMK
jgi:aminopeptidase N